MTLAERFWAKVRKSKGCWEWTGAKQHNGYGFIHTGGHVIRRPLRAHRASWELHYGPIPAGLWVLHRCDNPSCVRPDHLFLGSRSDNMKDCAAKGRVCTIGQANKTHCRRGHEFSPENTYVRPNGHRRCRICDAARQKARLAKGAR